jgi:glycosyltransferase involved in cell wall biosynthesis
MKCVKNPRVLYSTHPLAFQIYGGAEVQLLKTKEYLEKTGRCTIKLFDMFNDIIKDYDIMHNFMMYDDCMRLVQMAKSVGVKIVLSPIYWRGLGDSVKPLTPSFFERLYSNFRYYGYLTQTNLFPFKNFLELADIILPNSQLEANLLSRDFRINSKKFWVVPNGADETFAEGKPRLFAEKYGMTDYVLYVGRFVHRKNPMGVIKACKELNLPLVIIGSSSPREEQYYLDCKEMAESVGNIKLIGFLPHESEELRSAYAAAKVFVLPSNFETPGLSALEAGLSGCNIVITSEGATKEYFREHALYVNYGNYEDLKQKIKKAYEQPKSEKLKDLILQNYTWKNTAEKTFQAYESIIK